MIKDQGPSLASGDGVENSSDIEGSRSPVKFQRMTASRKQGAVLRLLKGDPLEVVARALQVTAAELSDWRTSFLDAGSASLKNRSRDGRDGEITRLKSKVGELTMDNELLHERISRMEEARPFVARRSKR